MQLLEALVMGPYVTAFLFLYGLFVFVMMSGIIVRYPYVIFSRYDIAIMAVVVFGIMSVDAVQMYGLITCDPSTVHCLGHDVTAIMTRFMRIILLTAFAWVMHNAVARQSATADGDAGA